MYIQDYFYRYATEAYHDNLILEGTREFRMHSLNDINYRLYKDEIKKFKTAGRTALLYIGGPLEHHSASGEHDIRVCKVPPVKANAGYMASRTAKLFDNVEFVSINANTCASSMYALYEAKRLLAEGFEDVIIYGEEWFEFVEEKLFRQIGVGITLSDGFFILHLSRKESDKKIEAVSWLWHNDRSEMSFSKEGYKKAMAVAEGEPIDLVKVHGSGTDNNTDAEEGAIRELFGEIEIVNYKKDIGHSQGVSTGVELCMLLDRHQGVKALVNASGLGNFYGSCLLTI